MMRKNIKRGAIVSALVVVAFFLVYLVLLAATVADVPEDTVGLLAALFAGSIFLAVIIGVLAALRQRLKEIDTGEEEDAKQF